MELIKRHIRHGFEPNIKISANVPSMPVRYMLEVETTLSTNSK